MKSEVPEIDFPLFPPEYRASGLLLHVTSLPSPYGIGDLGPTAFQWIDLLHQAGQHWWQALPAGPTGFGNSPYESLSSFAGNGLLISPDLLINDGLLQPQDCKGAFSSTAVDYEVVIPYKHRLLECAWARFQNGARKDLIEPYQQFCESQAVWLEDYALFRALKATYKGAHYLDWPPELVARKPAAIVHARRSLANEVDQVRLAQFLVFRQSNRLKEYARDKGIKLIGDLPFFVSPDSSDVWVNPELFLLDEHRRPRFRAGVPPDSFSAQGQLWGNPMYDWEAHRRAGFNWFIDRVCALLAQVDVIRLDHFRAFAAAWHVPAAAPTAQSGEWLPGPGPELFLAAHDKLGRLPFIAEDLGLITNEVTALRELFNIPGMRILQFAFDGTRENPHLPRNFSTNTVVYTGTHDNATTREWFEGLTDPERRRIWMYLGQPEQEIRDAAPEFIRLAWSSPAALAIAPLQDLLNLGREGRMNIPGGTRGNWRWRATSHMLSANEFDWLRNLTRTSNRSTPVQFPVLEEIS